MERKALVSKYVVLLEEPRPVYAAILIENEVIASVVKYSQSTPVAVVMDELQNWNPINLENCYISPGIIDLEVKSNGSWEGLETTTKTALAGGVTTVVHEPNHFQLNQPPVPLYTHLATLCIVNTNPFSSDAIALKAYLYPPSAYVSCCTVDQALQAAQKKNLPLIIDPSSPNPRMLYLASPCRELSLKARTELQELSDTTQFAGAFPDKVVESLDASPTTPKVEEEVLVKNRFSWVGSTENQVRSTKKRLSVMPDIRISTMSENVHSQLLDFMSPPKVVDGKHRKGLPDIYQDLNRRITNQESIEDLSKAEYLLYSDSGETQYERRSVSAGNAEEYLPSLQNKTLLQRRRLNLKPINIQKHKPKKENLYIYYLANCPESWETSGVEQVIRKFSDSNIRVHFTNLSSAKSVNIVRQAGSKLFTCSVNSYLLFFTDKDIEDSDTRFKAHPPIRTKANCLLLWDLLKMKAIDCVNSGHNPIHPDYKYLQEGDFRRALSGISSMGFTLQSVWTRLRQPNYSLKYLDHYIVRLAKWLSLHPAKVLKIDHLKGSIAEGKHADLIVWNPNEVIDPAYCESFPQMSVYRNKELQGKILQVYLKGKLAFDNGKFYAFGQKVTPKST